MKDCRSASAQRSLGDNLAEPRLPSPHTGAELLISSSSLQRQQHQPTPRRQDEVHVRLSDRLARCSTELHPILPRVPADGQTRRWGSDCTVANLQTARTWTDNCATATPRNFSRSLRGSRSPSRPGMSLSRVSGVFEFGWYSTDTVRRSPRQADQVLGPLGCLLHAP